MQPEKKDTRDFKKRNKSMITPQNLIELGKAPPQAVEIESAVLGAFMQDPQCLTNIIDILKPEVFYKEAHQIIFKAIERLFTKAEPADILTVVQELKKTGELEIAGGAFYVSQLTNRIASTANTEFHARIVLEKFIQRELIRISTDTLQHAYEDNQDVFELLSYAEENIFSISSTTIKKTFEHIKNILAKSLAEIESAKNQEFSGVPSGFTRLDAITGGFRKTDLIILAGRPGTGKSSFAMTAARNASVLFDKAIGVFSLEMPSTQLVNRLISAEAEIDADKLRHGEINDQQWQSIHRNIARLAESKIYIDDTPAISIFEFHAKAKRLKNQYNIEMIIVDYLQLMTTGSQNKFGNREQEVGLVSRSLKAMAKELDIPILALAQMSRSVEQRSDKRPQLSDLRDSGQIEMDADIVMFIHRPFICGIMQDENGMSTEGQAEIIIAKHRNGKIGSENLLFVEQFAKFMDTSEKVNGFDSPKPHIKEEFAHNMDEPIHQEAKIEPNRDFLNQGPKNTFNPATDYNEESETGF